MHFPFMDTIAGYVTTYDREKGVFELETVDGRRFDVLLGTDLAAEMLRNLDEPYADASAHVPDMLLPGCQLFVYGVFYPEGGIEKFEAKRVVFLGRKCGEFNFEKANWWINQVD